jgi:hypothetical protein
MTTYHFLVDADGMMHRFENEKPDDFAIFREIEQFRERIFEAFAVPALADGRSPVPDLTIDRTPESPS